MSRQNEIAANIMQAIWATPIQDRPASFRDTRQEASENVAVIRGMPALLSDLAPYIEAEIQREREADALTRAAPQSATELWLKEQKNSANLNAILHEIADLVRAAPGTSWEQLPVLARAEIQKERDRAERLEAELAAARAGLLGKPARADQPGGADEDVEARLDEFLASTAPPAKKTKLPIR